jgi:hypothetical protein
MAQGSRAAAELKVTVVTVARRIAGFLIQFKVGANRGAL